MSFVYIPNLWAFYTLCCILGNSFCLHYTFATPISNSQRSEKLFADFSDVPNIPVPITAGLLPLPNYKHLKYPSFNLGASPLGSPGLLDIFPINGSVPYAIARYLVADLLVTNPSFTASYEGSDIKKFNLHSLNYFCSTVNAGPAPTSVLIDCTLKFVAYYASKKGDGRMVKGGEVEVRFVPLPGGETPIINTRKSPMAFVDFGGEFDGAETVEIEYVKGRTIGLIGGVEVPEVLAYVGVDNLNYTVFYK
ncbi:hypothetical protein TWF192_009639 [Orbilia oligospora]|uniref:Uncharacterized protein n=1 Tax=Orbilia oligospora TaxID=2813651 RepID=A0A6G1M0G8_ORBOL|nr:hypothetical protein TWF191_010463 [Orbilia oligospora]KAF3239869.1 hypothetical protein TWF192_009639 [Orbilia oligospora]